MQTDERISVGEYLTTSYHPATLVPPEALFE